MAWVERKDDAAKKIREALKAIPEGEREEALRNGTEGLVGGRIIIDKTKSIAPKNKDPLHPDNTGISGMSA